MTSTSRTARCGPACRVVWEGPSEISRHPYPDCYHPADDVPAEQVRRLDHLLYGAEVLDHHRRRPADDLQKGVTFYDAGVGLTPVRRLGDFAVELAGAQAPVFLPLKAPSTPAFTGATATRDYGRHWTPVHIDFVVDDVEAALRRAVDAGARAESPVEAYS